VAAYIPARYPKQWALSTRQLMGEITTIHPLALNKRACRPGPTDQLVLELLSFRLFPVLL
jgi:hypothetical protein